MLNYLLFIFFVHATAFGDVKKPNFVVVLTDDQDLVLGGMTPLKNVRRFIGNEGVTFTNSYTVAPVCCPSRASLLTGMYVHNHHTINNSLPGGCYGESWKKHEGNTFATSLQNHGYNTFYAGKYMNQYGVPQAGGPEQVPPGWSEWHGLVGNSVYYNFTISNDGVPTHSTDIYLTDLVRDLGLNFIENQTESQPFLMMLSPPAPHQPFTPAKRHMGAYKNLTALRNPSFNLAVKDKHWLIGMQPSPLPDSIIPELDAVYRLRWETLLSVDEMVADIVETLNTHSLLENTYIIFTSDNGYHVGQFSQVYDKRQPYETDVKVPLLIKGPGIRKNFESHLPVLNIDLAPTILELAGLKPLDTMDGHPINLNDGELKERSFLTEYVGEGGNVSPKCPWFYDAANLSECNPAYDCKCQDSTNNTYACIRHLAEHINFKYCLFPTEDDFIEIYDLERDPDELTNAVDETLPAIKHWYELLLTRLSSCRGARQCDHPIPNTQFEPDTFVATASASSQALARTSGKASTWASARAFARA